MCKNADLPPLEPWDFLPWLERPEIHQTAEDHVRFLKAFCNYTDPKDEN